MIPLRVVNLLNPMNTQACLFLFNIFSATISVAGKKGIVMEIYTNWKMLMRDINLVQTFLKKFL